MKFGIESVICIHIPISSVITNTVEREDCFLIQAVRSTHGLEAPLSKGGNLLVPKSVCIIFLQDTL